MTAAQKKNVERFKKAAAEAKKLRKKNPKLTQAQAVKQAFAILYKTGKVAAVKKTATKKKATKKPARKKATAKSYHKDTKSHNVRISVMSGVNSNINFSVYSKGKRILITKSVTTAITEAKYLSSALGVPAYIKSGDKTFSKFVKGKLVK